LGRLIALSLALAAGCFTAPGFAAERPSYSAGDIVRHFGKPAKFGATRSLCLSAQEDCGAAAASADPAAPFNLDVTFELRSDSLTPEAKRNLDEFIKALGDPALESRRFFVDGHTDARGGDDYNIRLSQRRAESVAAYLAGHGVETARLTALGHGKSQPKTADPMDGANRRVETRLAD